MKVASTMALPIVAVLLVVAAGDEPSPFRCLGCGCSSFTNVCRLKCDMKEDIDYEYDVDHDPYCLPGVSEIQGNHWVPDCKSWLGWRKVLTWKPHCLCKVHTRKTLVKIPVVKKVPVYNCVVDRVCCKCGKSEIDAATTQQLQQQGAAPVVSDVPMDNDGSRGSAPD
jgi:hypothetical protein